MVNDAGEMERYDALVSSAPAGDLDVYADLVRGTQTVAYAVARRVLRDPALAEDATQNAYLRAFKRLGDLDDPAVRKRLQRIRDKLRKEMEMLAAHGLERLAMLRYGIDDVRKVEGASVA